MRYELLGKIVDLVIMSGSEEFSSEFRQELVNKFATGMRMVAPYNGAMGRFAGYHNDINRYDSTSEKIQAIKWFRQAVKDKTGSDPGLLYAKRYVEWVMGIIREEPAYYA